MNEIKINCVKCGKGLSADASMSEYTIKCPYCNNYMVVPKQQKTKFLTAIVISLCCVCLAFGIIFFSKINFCIGEKTITGQCFIVKNDGSSVKLASVPILIVNKENFIQYYHRRKTELMQDAAINSVKDEIQKKFNEFKEREKLCKDNDFDPERDEVCKALYRLFRASQVVGICKVMDLILHDMPNPEYVTQSDADGKFTAKIKSGEYVLCASSMRMIPGRFASDMEAYYWVVPLSFDKEEIMLSNDNIVSYQNKKCIINFSDVAGILNMPMADSQ